MKILAIVLIALITALVGFWYFGRKPYIHKNLSQSEIPRFLKILLNQGFNGGFLMIEIPGTEYFLQISKYMKELGENGLQLDFPKADWSKHFFPELEMNLRDNGYFYALESTGRADTTEFLIVNLKNDLERTNALIRLILEAVFKVSANQSINMYFSNVGVLPFPPAPLSE